MVPEVFRFPPDFLWGAATSGHQVEGGNRLSDWWLWEQVPGHVAGGDRSGRAADHYHRFREDIGLLADLGLNAYRFGVEWARVEPFPGEYDRRELDHYAEMVEACRERGVTPMVTLYHFTLPSWLASRGGWLWPGAPRRFAAYVERVVRALSPLGVEWWVTVNEPMVLVVQGFLTGVWPPQLRSPRAAMRAHAALVQAHHLAYETIHALAEGRPKAGVAQNMIDFVPLDAGSPADRRAAALHWRVYNLGFLRRIREQQDFVGLNYYSRSWSRWSWRLDGLLTPLGSLPGQRTTQMGWVWAPDGLGRTLEAAASFGRPVVVTENGIATLDDRERVRWIRLHLEQVAAALQRGIDVRGYFHWALLDNFEWAEGFRPRFGLIGVDYESQAREVRPSARYYGEIARSGSLLPLPAEASEEG
ncbi:MAG: glycoside hydrolase family 1 protein [Bacillota bacterium]|nr:glycoside hydrolase family 1 protein [Bacillota bacterium]